MKKINQLLTEANVLLEQNPAPPAPIVGAPTVAPGTPTPAPTNEPNATPAPNPNAPKQPFPTTVPVAPLDTVIKQVENGFDTFQASLKANIDQYFANTNFLPTVQKVLEATVISLGRPITEDYLAFFNEVPLEDKANLQLDNVYGLTEAIATDKVMNILKTVSKHVKKAVDPKNPNAKLGDVGVQLQKDLFGENKDYADLIAHLKSKIGGYKKNALEKLQEISGKNIQTDFANFEIPAELQNGFITKEQYLMLIQENSKAIEDMLSFFQQKLA